MLSHNSFEYTSFYVFNLFGLNCCIHVISIPIFFILYFSLAMWLAVTPHHTANDEVECGKYFHLFVEVVVIEVDNFILTVSLVAWWAVPPHDTTNEVVECKV